MYGTVPDPTTSDLVQARTDVVRLLAVARKAITAIP